MANSGKQDVQGKIEPDSKQAVPDESITETDAVPGGFCTLDQSEEYKMNHKRRGLALIFNQERFYWQLQMNDRNGTRVDRDSLERRFKELNFEVRVYDDLKTKEVLSKIDEAASASHVDADCFVCVFLSHGKNDHLYAYDGIIPIRDITDKFKGDVCRSLVGKPKIFVIQACRGDKHDNPVTPMDAVDNAVDANQTVVDAAVLYTLPAGADFLMCYSVAEGYYSHRDILNGSWYIRDLCEVLKEHGQSLEITEMLTLVNRKVSMRRVMNSLDRSSVGKKQVPCFASMLTKKLYFRAKTF